MTEIFDFQKKKGEKHFKELDQKNELYIELSLRLSNIYFDLVRNRFGRDIDMREYLSRETKTLFKNEQDFRNFITSFLKVIKKEQIPVERFSIEKNVELADVLDEIVDTLFEEKYPQYKD